MVVSMDRDEWLAELGVTLRTCRIRAGLSHAELGQRCGRSQGTIYAWERGHSHPQLPVLFDLATALGVHPAELLPSVPDRDGSYATRVQRLLAEIDRQRDMISKLCRQVRS